MSRHTRIAVGVVAIVFVAIAIYSGILIYRHKHNNSSLSLLHSISGQSAKSKAPVTKSDSGAALNTSQSNQYINGAMVSEGQQKDNTQRQVVIDFYTQYLKNKKEGKSQVDTLAKYGTAKLASQYNGAKPGVDLLTCAADDSKSSMPSLVSISSVAPIDNFMNYALMFSDSKTAISDAQAQVIGQGADSRIDLVSCLVAR